MRLENTAFIFPGQGSQYAGMGLEICENFEQAEKTFYEADKALNYPISKLCFHGPEDELKLTYNTQPALLTVSTAIWEILKDNNIEPEAVAGHSLGEYSALVCAGVIPFKDAVKIVRKRGEFMQDAVPVGVGKMAAVLNLTLEKVEEVLNSIREEGKVLSVANINSPAQIVIAGHADMVDKAMPALKEAGARRVVELPVSAPFHCELMQPARENLSPFIDEVEFNKPAYRFYSNVTANPLDNPEEIKEKLKEQITHPVKWLQLIENMIKDGIDTFVEIGAGRVLSGLVRKIDRSVNILNIEDMVSLEKFLRYINE